jgi:hypothetical protein
VIAEVRGVVVKFVGDDVGELLLSAHADSVCGCVYQDSGAGVARASLDTGLVGVGVRKCLFAEEKVAG